MHCRSLRRRPTRSKTLSCWKSFKPHGLPVLQQQLMEVNPEPVDVYSTTVREIVLTELSNLVLWSFKTYFADTGEQPDASQVETVMRLVRLVDSVALSRGEPTAAS